MPQQEHQLKNIVDIIIGIPVGQYTFLTPFKNSCDCNCATVLIISPVKQMELVEVQFVHWVCLPHPWKLVQLTISGKGHTVKELCQYKSRV